MKTLRNWKITALDRGYLFEHETTAYSVEGKAATTTDRIESYADEDDLLKALRTLFAAEQKRQQIKSVAQLSAA